MPQGEPKPRVRLPKPPDHLSDEGKAEWKRIGKMLVGLGVMTELDATGLAAYCAVYARWIEAREKVKEFGIVILSPDKKFPVISPYLSIENRAFDQMTKMLGEFGALPSSRTRVHGKPAEKKKSGLATMLEGNA